MARPMAETQVEGKPQSMGVEAEAEGAFSPTPEKISVNIEVYPTKIAVIEYAIKGEHGVDVIAMDVIEVKSLYVRYTYLYYARHVEIWTNDGYRRYILGGEINIGYGKYEIDTIRVAFRRMMAECDCSCGRE